jgi:UV DNA damage endonuclease
MHTKNGRIGYACLEIDANETYKTCRLKTFHDKGLTYINELCVHNAQVLLNSMKRNAAQHIHMFRISSNLLPWHHLYKVEQLSEWDQIKHLYTEIGNVIKQNDIRVSFHPDHFTVLASNNPRVVERSIEDMEHHSFLLDLLDAPINHNAKINIHISNTKPDKQQAIKRFIASFNSLSSRTKSRVTIENDDNINGYTVEDLYTVYEQIGTPIVFDSLHYACNPGKLNYKDALSLAVSTWGDIVPVVHHSSSKTHEDPKGDKAAHSDYLFESFNYEQFKVDVMLEAKAKNLALQHYVERFNLL